MTQTVQLKKTVIISVQAERVKSIQATLESGAAIAVEGPISVGDYNIIDANGAASILTAADYAAELVPVAAA